MRDPSVPKGTDQFLDPIGSNKHIWLHGCACSCNLLQHKRVQWLPRFGNTVIAALGAMARASAVTTSTTKGVEARSFSEHVNLLLYRQIVRYCLLASNSDDRNVSFMKLIMEMRKDYGTFGTV